MFELSGALLVLCLGGAAGAAGVALVLWMIGAPRTSAFFEELCRVLWGCAIGLLLFLAIVGGFQWLKELF